MAKENFLTLQLQIKKLQAKAEYMRNKQKEPALASIVRSMRSFDLTIEDVKAALEGDTAATRKARGRPAGSKDVEKVKREVAPKYRHPDSGETWSGRGKAPRWLVAAEAAGSSRESFLIAK